MPRAVKPTPTEIESQYDSGQYRLTQERSDFLLPQIIDFVRQKRWMNLRPEYQRRLVWDRKKKSLFIESLLMNIPIPPVFLYETDLSRYEVMDGQQRLNTILEFYENRLKLTGLETWHVLNGNTYDSCPPRIRSGLDRRRISANVLLAESATTQKDVNFIRRTVFERLNTGGQPLNQQELRNSLYAGPFNDLITNRLARLRLFNSIWDIPSYDDHYREKDGFISKELSNNKLFRRMGDCEIILRFFAFRDETSIRGSVRTILDRCMERYREASPPEIQKLEQTFSNCLSIAHSIFGKHTFRIVDKEGGWKLSQPLFDAVMVSIDRLGECAEKLPTKHTKIAQELNKILKVDVYYDTLVGKPNTAQAIKQRISIVEDIFTKFL